MNELNKSALVAFRQTEHHAQLASRVNEDNPNHHLWNNRGTWWCHFTIHRPDYTSERVRVSLKTRDVELARARRDELLDTLSA
ncbi:MAG: hypothetical protein P1U58_12805 [Verrucomicrobiales bacterium]|nr:hypothetical protein [Verrucomicrobiales bacterium]